MTTAIKAVLLGDAMIPVRGFEQAWRKHLGAFGDDLVVGATAVGTRGRFSSQSTNGDPRNWPARRGRPRNIRCRCAPPSPQRAGRSSSSAR